MKEYPLSFLVRLQPKHKNIIKKYENQVIGKSEAAVIRFALEFMDFQVKHNKLALLEKK